MSNPTWVTAAGPLAGSPFVVDVPVSIQLLATPSTVGNTILYAALNGSLPSGLSLSSASGLITGAPTTPTVPYTYTTTSTGVRPTNPIVGSQYFNSTSLEVYNGTAWVSASTAVVSLVAPETKPDGSPLAVGDLWSDPSTCNTISVYNGIRWVYASGSLTNQATYDITIRASELSNGKVVGFTDRIFTMVVNYLSWITESGDLGTFSELAPFTYTFVGLPKYASGSTLSYTLLSGNFPDNSFSLDSVTGVLTGTLNEVELLSEISFVLRLTETLTSTNSTVAFVDRAFSIVIDGPDSPTISSITLTTPDSTYVNIMPTVTTSPANQSYVVTKTSGNLPPGLEIDSLGRITGYPLPPTNSVLCTGTITTDITTEAIIGTGTLFTTELAVGQTISDSSGRILGKIDTIIDDLNAVLVYQARADNVDVAFNKILPINSTYLFELTVTVASGTDTSSCSITVNNQELVFAFAGRRPIILNNAPLGLTVSTSDPYAAYYTKNYLDFSRTEDLIGTVNDASFFTYKAIGYDFDNPDDETELVYSITPMTAVTVGAPTLTYDFISDDGWIGDQLPIIGNTIFTYTFTIGVNTKSRIAAGLTGSPTVTLTLNISGAINTQFLKWTASADNLLGTVINGQICTLSVGTGAIFKLISGTLPPNLSISTDGSIVGKLAFESGTTVTPVGTTTTYTFTVGAYSSPTSPYYTARTYTLNTYQKYGVPYDNIYLPCALRTEQHNQVSNLLKNLRDKFAPNIVATFFVDKASATAYTVTLYDGGRFYSVGDVIVIDGEMFTGTFLNNLIIIVDSVNTDGTIISFTHNGTPPIGMTIGVSMFMSAAITANDFIYRPMDNNFGLSASSLLENISSIPSSLDKGRTLVRMGHLYGMPTLPTASIEAAYEAAMTFNHYVRHLIVGGAKKARALDSNGNVKYEVIYCPIIDELENENGVSISKQIIWPTNITVATDTTVQPPTMSTLSNILYPNSLHNMRQQLSESAGASSALINSDEVLPEWMTTVQEDGSVLGYIPAWVICYVKPGNSDLVLREINRYMSSVKFAPNQINFQIDRISIDRSMTYSWTGSAWPAIPSAPPTPGETLDSHDVDVYFPRRTILDI
jgi:hypothetical protein